MLVDQIYSILNNSSAWVLNSALSLEAPTQALLNNFWGKVAEWGFILIATVIAAIVAVKVDRKFRNHERINNWKLWKEVIMESFSVTFGIFMYGVLIGIGIIITIRLINLGMKFSALVTLLIIIGLLLFWRYKRTKKKKELVKRLQRGKQKKQAMQTKA
jgi:cytochrome c biogenesis protein CcdA